MQNIPGSMFIIFGLGFLMGASHSNPASAEWAAWVMVAYGALIYCVEVYNLKKGNEE